MTTRAKRRKQLREGPARSFREFVSTPAERRHLDAMTAHDRGVFEDNPDLEAFVRPGFPCELPDDIAQSYASEGLELAGVMVINVRPGLRMRKFFFQPIRRTGERPC